ncbi:Protein of unknown function [Gryllus bimaculatus]|nr:Protein of unknown function [Gryllus bimaculatus]
MLVAGGLRMYQERGGVRHRGGGAERQWARRGAALPQRLCREAKGRSEVKGQWPRPPHSLRARHLRHLALHPHHPLSSLSSPPSPTPTSPPSRPRMGDSRVGRGTRGGIGRNNALGAVATSCPAPPAPPPRRRAPAPPAQPHATPRFPLSRSASHSGNQTKKSSKSNYASC